MRLRWSVLLVAVLLVTPVLVEGQPKQKPKWVPSPHVAPTEPLRPEEQVKKFRLPPGFEMQLVAADPDIRKPINIAFDARGRLWVTETIEYPFPAAEGKGRDAVKILEDFGPDGRARKITTFADGLNIPIGVQPVDERTALVFSIPSIFRMTDTDGDGKADRREPLYTGYGYKDTHGMTGEFQLGFDGWVYACHGYANQSRVKSRGDTAIQMHSGNTYRFKPDGARIEYFTRGQVNPFGLALDPLGNLYSADCHTRPLYQLLQGAWYPSFGKPHDGLGFGPEMVTHDHGSTGIAGVAYYAADQYPDAFRDNLFVGNVITNRVNRDRIERHGSTSRGVEMPDFVRSDDPWFRPVDVKLGPDGCLYVADFYNRIIGHYEVPLDHPGRDRDKGRIWRIVYRGPDGKGQPRPVKDLTKLSPAELVAELAGPNLTVRVHATEQLVRRGDEAVAAVRPIMERGTATQRAHGLWVLERLGKLDDATLTAASKAPEALVRVHAQRVLAERKQLTPEERALALAGLQDSDAYVQRTAVQVLGTHPQAENVAPLLALRERVPPQDTHLLHVVRMALRDQLRPVETWAKLTPQNLGEKEQRALADVVPGVHNVPSAEFLKAHLQRFPESNAATQRYAHYVVRYGPDGGAGWVIDLARSRYAKDLGMQGNLLRAVQQATQERGAALGKSERAYAEELVGRLLRSPRGNEVQTGIDLAAALKLVEAQPALLRVAADPKADEPRRKAAVGAAVAVEPARAVGPLRALLLSDKEALNVREQVASALAGTNRPEAHAALVQALQSAPARLQTVIAQGMAGTGQGGEKLLEAVAAGKASPRLLQDRAIELKLKQARVNQVDQRLAKLTKGLPPADQKAQALIFQRRDAFLHSKADVTAGQKVFATHCAACHTIANQGAKVGPQLDGIGIRGVERLLEDVIDPNRNVDQAFRTASVELDDGRVLVGLPLREEGEVLVLADNQGKEQRVARPAIQARHDSQMSVMPSNFAERMSAEELNHLLAYLLAQRVKE